MNKFFCKFTIYKVNGKIKIAYSFIEVEEISKDLYRSKVSCQIINTKNNILFDKKKNDITYGMVLELNNSSEEKLAIKKVYSNFKHKLKFMFKFKHILQKRVDFLLYG